MKNGNIIGESEMSYLITDDSLLPYLLQIEERLRQLKTKKIRISREKKTYNYKTVRFYM